jgi:hypothetical protein
MGDEDSGQYSGVVRQASNHTIHPSVVPRWDMGLRWTSVRNKARSPIIIGKADGKVRSEEPPDWMARFPESVTDTNTSNF